MKKEENIEKKIRIIFQLHMELQVEHLSTLFHVITYLRI